MNPAPDRPEQPHLDLDPVKLTGLFMVPPELLADYADMGDMLAKALRGEIELKPLPPPRWHRCVFCWLVSLLPGHDRCDHGRVYCDDCISDY